MYTHYTPVYWASTLVHFYNRGKEISLSFQTTFDHAGTSQYDYTQMAVMWIMKIGDITMYTVRVTRPRRIFFLFYRVPGVIRFSSHDRQLFHYAVPLVANKTRTNCFLRTIDEV